MLLSGRERIRNVLPSSVLHIRNGHTDFNRDFFVKHSDDEAREARYQHRTWRKADGGFYVGVDPPAGAKVEGIVSSNSNSCSPLALTCSSTIRALGRLAAVQCTMDVSQLRASTSLHL